MHLLSLSLFLLHLSATLIVSSTSPWSSSFPPFSLSLLLSLHFSPSLTSSVLLHPSPFFQIILSLLGVNQTPCHGLNLHSVSSHFSYHLPLTSSLTILLSSSPSSSLLTRCFLSLPICKSSFANSPIDLVFQPEHFFLPVISLYLSFSLSPLPLANLHPSSFLIPT